MKIRYQKILLVLITVTAFVCSSAIAQNAELFATARPASQYADSIEQARDIVLEIMEGDIPGFSIAVGVYPNLVWAEGFGYANVEHRVPVTPLTKFRIGSVSKPMTTVALGLLVEQGKIDLDAPIQKYLPSFPAKPEGTITSRLLAAHQAGIRHYRPDGSDNLIMKHYEEVVDALEIFANDPLKFAPGTDYSYSSHGYNLLSAVMQEAAGVPFLELMRTAVWGPMELQNTVADHTDYIIENRASPYSRRSDGTFRNGPYVDNSYKWAGGGFLSTPSDLVKFGFAVMNGGFLKPETLEMLVTPLTPGSGKKTNYGLGWRTDTEDNGRTWIGHGGGSVGGTTVFQTNAESGVVIATTCNLSGARYANRIAEIANLFIR